MRRILEVDVMAGQQERFAAPTVARRAGITGDAVSWMRARLLPSGENVLMLVAYVMVLIAIVTFVLARPSEAQLPAWRYYGTILALAALLVLQATSPDLEMLLGETRGQRFWLLPSGALFLIADWLSGGYGYFIHYLIFMLTAQAFVAFSVQHALLYTSAISAGWLGLVWLWDGTGDVLLRNALSMGSGLFFSALFSVTIRGYSKHTRRTEALLAELQRANVELAAAREREKDLAVAEERVRLARDIHDGLGHHLTVLNVQLQAAAKLIPVDLARAEETIGTCRREAQAALQEVRESVAAMRRTPLDGRTLDEALRALVGDFDRSSPLVAAFACNGVARDLSPAAAMTLYRAAQEGLTNAQKHSAARNVSVTLSYEHDRTVLAVHDDGAGQTSGSGFGLAGLRERAEQLGGTLEAEPLRDGGFLLTLCLPAERDA
jgi:signal transduction histidine kinase